MDENVSAFSAYRTMKSAKRNKSNLKREKASPSRKKSKLENKSRVNKRKPEKNINSNNSYRNGTNTQNKTRNTPVFKIKNANFLINNQVKHLKQIEATIKSKIMEKAVEQQKKPEVTKKNEIKIIKKEVKERKKPEIKVLKSRSKKIMKTNEINHKSEDKIKFNFDKAHSVQNGEEMLKWVLNPLPIREFFELHWEKQPLCIKRKQSSYYSSLLSSNVIDHVLRHNELFFTKNIDITSYSQTEHKRETHNPEGQATAPRVWDYYSNGCSVRFLNPQTYIKPVHVLNATLQELFGCFVGANLYLTPAGTQGFAPHYDDIEAFVLQVEGKKRWKLYSARNEMEVLPRFSSENFRRVDLPEPFYECVLEPGDLLYFPRGVIHEAEALDDTHSLHITLSVYQKNTWTDLLEELLPAALKIASEEDVTFRQGLPMNYLRYMGLVHSDTSSSDRTEFVSKLHSLIDRLFQHAPIDGAVDQIAKRFIHDALPPVLQKEEIERTAFGDGERIRNGFVVNRAEFDLDTRVKLIRYNCLRLVQEEDTIRVYYTTSNSREYRGNEPQYMEIEDELAIVIEKLIYTYPDYVSIEDLPIQDDTVKIQIVSDLWERGLILTEEILGGNQSDSE